MYSGAPGWGYPNVPSKIDHMGEIPVEMSLPLDADGFLRRECPTCERQFKWWHTPPSEGPSGEVQEEPEAYYCPYCQEPAPLGSWWTHEQVEYMQQLAVAEALGPQLWRMKNNLERESRRSKGISFEASTDAFSRPEPLVESEDMRRVDMPCHPEEPLKVDEEWDAEVACLVCGIRYPVVLVKALPDEDEA